jgi:hypothetical protein
LEDSLRIITDTQRTKIQQESLIFFKRQKLVPYLLGSIFKNFDNIFILEKLFINFWSSSCILTTFWRKQAKVAQNSIRILIRIALFRPKEDLDIIVPYKVRFLVQRTMEMLI